MEEGVGGGGGSWGQTNLLLVLLHVFIPQPLQLINVLTHLLQHAQTCHCNGNVSTVHFIQHIKHTQVLSEFHSQPHFSQVKRQVIPHGWQHCSGCFSDDQKVWWKLALWAKNLIQLQVDWCSQYALCKWMGNFSLFFSLFSWFTKLMVRKTSIQCLNNQLLACFLCTLQSLKSSPTG